ncbi:NAD(P)H-binding protein [Pseudomonas sp. RIT-PI-AD]|uniref:NAD(P)-dependent oxidoreductase n=1 Tax=Pseudomonas sp. RIT-PI-AD TaxID=3035294 RepID=UPI0021D9EC0B|nr:NAD(P)H-binding protein [Pseudomonas sp. RIT-PI-AD]
MKNLETPLLKFALYGAQSSIGSALLVQLLNRQHEGVAILSDLNALTARPGLRAKSGDLFDALSVSESVAGMDAVIAVLSSPRLPAGDQQDDSRTPRRQLEAIEALALGMPRVKVDQLLLIGDFAWLDGPAQLGDLAERVQDALQRSTLRWTLVNAPAVQDGLSIDDLRSPGETPTEQVRQELLSFAACAVDELENPQHLGKRMNVRL